MTKEKGELFIEFIKNNTTHKENVELLVVKDDIVFILRPENGRKYTKEYRDFTNEVKMYLSMFGLTKIFECINITDENKTFNNVHIHSSGSTFVNLSGY